MSHILACVTQEHDIRLVLLAVLVCLLASLTAFKLIASGRDAAAARDRWMWTAAAAVVAGCGVWATHFVAMLAYRPGLPVGYDVALTVLSLAIAVAVIGCGFAVGLAGSAWAALGGAVVGAGIGAMHYTGMAAMQVAGEAAHDPLGVGVSIVIGIVLGALAFRIREYRPGLRADACAGIVFALAIVGLHFTAMAALTLTPDAAMPRPDEVTAPEWLAVAVTAVTLMIIASGLAGSVVDRRLAERKAEAERLRERVVALEAVKQELEATGANLRDALDRAAASNQTKSEFLATISHELRTPLNAVIGFSELLGLQIHGKLGDPRYEDYATSIRDSGAHLLELIGDVLDFAKIDAGRLSLANDEVNIPELFAAAQRIVQGAAADAGLQLRVDAPAPDLPQLRVDQRRVRQILLNLLSNAIKFTPGPGLVTMAARRSGPDLVLSVSDTGIGIAPDDLPTALEPFGQVGNRLARTSEGTGLGLPLCKQLMELHGGLLQLESDPGSGTTVSLTFPAERLIWPQGNDSAHSAEPPQPERPQNCAA